MFGMTSMFVIVFFAAFIAAPCLIGVLYFLTKGKEIVHLENRLSQVSGNEKGNATLGMMLFIALIALGYYAVLAVHSTQYTSLF